MNPHLAGLVVAVFGAVDRDLPEMLNALGVRIVSPAVNAPSPLSAAGRPLDVAILDVRATNRLPDDVSSFRRRHPDAALVLITRGLVPTLILEAMRAGIAECITDSLTVPVLESALRRVIARRAPDAAGELFAFVGAKGGVGTTTVAVNVATSLARTNQRTLFVDLHVAYGDAAVFLGAEPRFSIVDALENIHRLDEALFKTLVVSTQGGVDLLASSSPGQLKGSDASRLHRLLDFARQHYRFVVVDCPRSDAALLDAMEPVSRIVLVANQELATLRSGSRMAAALRHRHPAERIMVVVSRFDPSAEIGQDDVERVIGSQVKHMLPSDYRLSLEALNRGRPLVLKNHSRLAGSLDALARDLCGNPASQPESAKTPGLFGRLTGRR